MQAIVDYLNEVPLAAFMLVIAIGYTVGRVTWHGIALGPAAGTLGVAILLGALGLDFTHIYGMEDPPFTLGALGFALFLYSVGFEAGPRFFSHVLGGRGARYVFVGMIVVFVGFFLAWGLGSLFELGAAVTAGALSGAMTSAASYAAALEVVRDDPGLSGALSVSFALTYPLGLVLLVFVIQALPKLGRRGTCAVKDADGRTAPVEAGPTHADLTRAFEVTRDEVTGRTLADLDLPRRVGVHVTRIHRGDAVLAPSGATTLQPGDHVLVRGRLEELRRVAEIVGPEVYDADLRRRMPAARRMVVHAREAVGHTLRDLDLARRCGVLVVGIDRGGVHLEPSAETALLRGDVLEVIGSRRDVRRTSAELGRLERPTHETDIGIYAGGIFLGVLIGTLSLTIGGVALSLGAAGGLLLAGILLGRTRRIGRFTTHVPRPARLLVRELGILLFVAEAGVRAGNSPLGALEGRVLPILLAGLVLSLVPALTALWVACRSFRLRPIEALGAVSGGMTSSAALATVRRVADDEDPAVAYAAAFAVASVLVTIAGRLLILLMM